ncbi:hypothetical protein ACQPZJ_26085 [Actinoplanes sp. CA-054009]
MDLRQAVACRPAEAIRGRRGVIVVEGAGPVLTQLLTSDLAAERSRRSALDQRGIAIVTSSGTLTALLAGLATFVAIDKNRPTPSGVALIAFACAVLGFILAAYFGLLTNRSRAYEVLDEYADMDVLRSQEVWSKSADVAYLVVFDVNVRTLRTLRAGNDQKSRFVNRGLVTQLTALVLLAIAAAVNAVQVIAG